MACLEYIHYKPHRPKIGAAGLEWGPELSVPPIERLPQIFWADGNPWNEVNLWALETARSRNVKLKTIKSLMEHLHKYANWLEHEEVDWRHFPQNKADRVLIRYRGALIDARGRGELSPSTTTARMRAVIRFYRYCSGRNFISRDAAKWQDKLVVVRLFDSVGFERTLQRITTDISIPNRDRPGVRLEGGLLPLNSEHMLELLRFSKMRASEELHLMLTIGCFTGARIETITTLHIPAIEQAIRDPKVPGMWILPIGPGTSISTKNDVSGDLMIPEDLMIQIREYAGSKRHIERMLKASKEDKRLLFLTRYGEKYMPTAMGREMVELRRRGMAAGLKFLQKFKFHQTRATYGTWLMSICLKSASVKASIEFVKRAMHHKNEVTTFGYITFIEHTKAKIEIAKAFTEAFFGLKNQLSEAKNA